MVSNELIATYCYQLHVCLYGYENESLQLQKESDTMEATAQFDFNARSERELSLRKGDLVILRKQVSNDWWHGTVKGKDGLIPDKYISLKIKYVFSGNRFFSVFSSFIMAISDFVVLFFFCLFLLHFPFSFFTRFGSIFDFGGLFLR